jgi:hypothetical protein
MNMKDPSLDYRKALYTALNGKVKLNNVAVPVYNYVPETAAYPFIYIHTQTTDEIGTKDCFFFDHMINIDVVYGVQTDAGGDAVADGLMNQITQLLMTKTYPFTISSSFQHICIICDNIGNASSVSDTHQLNSKSMRVTSKIKQLN